MADRILRDAELRERVGLGRTTIWRMERAGEFPRRRQIGGNIVGWLSSEVDEWIESRPVADAVASAADEAA